MGSVDIWKAPGEVRPKRSVCSRIGMEGTDWAPMHRI